MNQEPMTVILADQSKDENLDECMEIVDGAKCDKPSDWIIFGCLTYCDDCLPTHFHYLREEEIGGGEE